VPPAVDDGVDAGGAVPDGADAPGAADPWLPVPPFGVGAGATVSVAVA
jgi:hypothetical protein